MAYQIILRDCGNEIERKSAPTMEAAIDKAIRLCELPDTAPIRSRLKLGDMVTFDDSETVEIART